MDRGRGKESRQNARTGQGWAGRAVDTKDDHPLALSRMSRSIHVLDAPLPVRHLPSGIDRCRVKWWRRWFEYSCLFAVVGDGDGDGRWWGWGLGLGGRGSGWIGEVRVSTELQILYSVF